MKHNDLRALIAAPIYAELRTDMSAGIKALMRDALEEADQLLAIAGERPDGPESDEPVTPPPTPNDPYFVIHRETSKAISSPRAECPPVPRNMMLTSGVGAAIEEIDAGFFSGDRFIDLVSIEYMEWHIGRWVREITRNRKLLEQERQATPIAPDVNVSTGLREGCRTCYGTDHTTENCSEDIPF